VDRISRGKSEGETPVPKRATQVILSEKELNKIYLVSVDEVVATRAHLRLTPPKNKNQYGHRMASEYEL
jgi:hypothetical protein